MCEWEAYRHECKTEDNGLAKNGILERGKNLLRESGIYLRNQWQHGG